MSSCFNITGGRGFQSRTNTRDMQGKTLPDGYKMFMLHHPQLDSQSDTSWTAARDNDDDDWHFKELRWRFLFWVQ